MSNLLQSWVNESEESQKLYAREALMVDVTEDLLIAMEDKGITKTELAKKLGKSKAQISKTLNGMSNITLRTLSDFCFALDISPVITIRQPDRITTKLTIVSKITPNNWIVAREKQKANEHLGMLQKRFNIGEPQKEYAA